MLLFRGYLLPNRFQSNIFFFLFPPFSIIMDSFLFCCLCFHYIDNTTTTTNNNSCRIVASSSWHYWGGNDNKDLNPTVFEFEYLNCKFLSASFRLRNIDTQQGGAPKNLAIKRMETQETMLLFAWDLSQVRFCVCVLIIGHRTWRTFTRSKKNIIDFRLLQVFHNFPELYSPSFTNHNLRIQSQIIWLRERTRGRRGGEKWKVVFVFELFNLFPLAHGSYQIIGPLLSLIVCSIAESAFHFVCPHFRFRNLQPLCHLLWGFTFRFGCFFERDGGCGDFASPLHSMKSDQPNWLWRQ